MRVGVNNPNDRLVGHRGNTIQQQLTPATQFRINKRHPVRPNEDATITPTKLVSAGTAPTNDVQIAFDGLNLRSFHGRRV